MDRFLALIVFLVLLLGGIISFPDGNILLIIGVIGSLAAVLLIRKFGGDRKLFLQRLYVLAFLVRYSFAVFIDVFSFRAFLSGDSTTYNNAGVYLMNIWYGIPNDQMGIYYQGFSSAIGWGMTYFVASVYSLTGVEMFAPQAICIVLGAATPPLVYFCSRQIFNNDKSAKIAAILVAFYPAFVIWTSQLLKDGLIVFFLVLAVTMGLLIREKFSFPALVTLVISLLAILSLRFYVFYIVVVALGGAYLVNFSKSGKVMIRSVAVLTLVAIGLAYYFSTDTGGRDIQSVSFESLEASRKGAEKAGSGFGDEVDYDSTEGVLSALPVGLSYSLFAPFPWQFNRMVYLIVLPDMVIWWCSIPFLIIGLSYTIKYKLRDAMSLLLFCLLLAIGYGLFQGNIGTAYRHRIQIQVFLFIFVAVGWVVWGERSENKRILDIQRDKAIRRS